MHRDEKRRNGPARPPSRAQGTPEGEPGPLRDSPCRQGDADAAPHQARRRCAQWYDNAPAGCLMLDREGVLLDLNQTAAALLGRERADLLGASLDACLAPASRLDFVDYLESAFASSAQASGDFTLWRDAAQPPCVVRLDSRVLNDPDDGSICLTSLTDVTEHKRTEAALRESEERFRVLVSSASQAVWETSAEGLVVADSPSWRAYTGQTLEEWLGNGWADAVHPEDRGEAVRRWREAVASGRNLNAELRLRTADGSWCWTNVHAAPIRDTSGAILKWVGMNLDITEHKRAQRALQAREQQQAAVAELGQLALSSGDFQALLEAVTTILASILEVEYTKILELLPEGDKLLLRAGTGWRPGVVGHTVVPAGNSSQSGYTLATNEPVVVEDHGTETRFHGPQLLIDHQVVSGLSCVIAGPDGRPWGVIGAHTRQRRHFTRDDVNFLSAVSNVLAAVIERRHFIKALHEREDDLNRAQAVGGIGSWRLDLRRNKLTWSAQNHRIFGIPEGTELTYESFLAAVHPDDRDYVDRKWLAALRGEAYDIEHRLIVDGQVKWVRERAELEFGAEGELLGGFGTTHDITELKRAEEALREDDRRKNEFLAMLAHELRNPLAPIRNAVEILKLHGSPDPASLEARNMIERQLMHMVRLIDDLLDISRITQGRLHLRKESIALAEVIDHAVAASAPDIERAGHRLTASLPSQPLFLEADPVRLTQVFLNLLNNACKYTAKPGSIRIAADQEGNEVVVRVQDSGAGIAPEHLPHLFDMFARKRVAVERSQSGLGIGLPLSRRLIEMHGGSIAAHSEGPGHGSEFIIRLPAAAGPDVAAPSRSLAAAGGAPTARRVLVVDDNRDIAQSLAMVLELEGSQVEMAYDGLEAIEAVERYRPDAVVLDIGMPELDGYAACRRIRALPYGKDMLIIAMTGWGQDEDRDKTREAGFDAHLVKPVEPSVLLKLLADPGSRSR